MRCSTGQDMHGVNQAANMSQKIPRLQLREGLILVKILPFEHLVQNLVVCTWS